MNRAIVTWICVGLAFIAVAALLVVGVPLALVVLTFEDPATSVVDLPSGGRVELLSPRWDDGDAATWELEYRTRIRLADRQKLADEVSAVWDAMASDADRSGAAVAIIRPVSFSRRVKFDGLTPVVQSHESTLFSYVRAASGRWRRADGWPKPSE